MLTHYLRPGPFLYHLSNSWPVLLRREFDRLNFEYSWFVGLRLNWVQWPGYPESHLPKCNSIYLFRKTTELCLPVTAHLLISQGSSFTSLSFHPSKTYLQVRRPVLNSATLDNYVSGTYSQIWLLVWLASPIFLTSVLCLPAQNLIALSWMRHELAKILDSISSFPRYHLRVRLWFTVPPN